MLPVPATPSVELHCTAQAEEALGALCPQCTCEVIVRGRLHCTPGETRAESAELPSSELELIVQSSTSPMSNSSGRTTCSFTSE